MDIPRKSLTQCGRRLSPPWKRSEYRRKAMLKKTHRPTQADCATAFRTRWMHAGRRSTSAHRLNTVRMSNWARGSILRAVEKRRGRIRMQRGIGTGRAVARRSRSLRQRSKTTSKHTKTLWKILLKASSFSACLFCFPK